MIVAVVQRYIDAMMAKDTTFLRAATLPGATFVAIAVRGAADAVSTVRTADEFIAGQGQRTQRFLGRIWSPRVSVEGPIAVFIAPYDAYLDGAFSHCGIDHYILAREADRWRVTQLIFSRQGEGCPPSPLGPPH